MIQHSLLKQQNKQHPSLALHKVATAHFHAINLFYFQSLHASTESKSCFPFKKA